MSCDAETLRRYRQADIGKSPPRPESNIRTVEPSTAQREKSLAYIRNVKEKERKRLNPQPEESNT